MIRFGGDEEEDMDYFAKKQWIRIAVCAVLVGVIVLAMTGVFSGTGSLVYDPSAPQPPQKLPNRASAVR